MATSYQTRIGRVIGIILLSLCVGCAESATQRANRVEPLLSEAGFTVVPADNPTRVAKLNDLTPLKVTSFSQGSKTRYWFADPYVCKCVFRGTEQNYAMYRTLVKQEDLAEAMDNYQVQQSYDTYMGGAADQVFYGQ